MKPVCCMFLLFLAGKSFGQPIELWNPSFEEDSAACCTTPTNWRNCGSPQETPPDIQPGFFGVDLPAAEGHHYISLVVRDDGTTEAIGQELIKPLEGYSIYLLTVFVARSRQFVSATKNSQGQPVPCITPVKLNVWGANSPCDRKQLLGETIVITTQWAETKLILQPEADMKYIILEASYKTPNLFSYNGNVLIDNLSLTQIP